ncbi:MAG: flagellar basal body rod protein FlgC [Anaerofustis sp.]
MAFLNSLNISGSGLTASRLRMDVISENIANATTTRTEDGGPYRRKVVVYESMDNSSSSFSSIYRKKLDNNSDRGVRVAEIAEDQSEFQSVYDPTNPDADESGYVQMPNVDLVEETVDMMAVSRAYDANLTAFNAMKSMAEKALQIQGE